MIARLRAWWANLFDDRSTACRQSDHEACAGATDGAPVRVGWGPCGCACHWPAAADPA